MVKAAGLAFGSVRENERERYRVRERATEGELNKTPPHLHSVSAIQHLAEMASTPFSCSTGL